MRRFFLLAGVISLAVSCGQVTEEEATLSALADGATSTQYVDADGNVVNVVLGENGAPTIVDADGNPIVEETDTTTDTDTDEEEVLVGLAAAAAEMSERLDECNGSTCDFNTQHEITDGIVTYVTSCSTCNNSLNKEVWVHDQSGQYGLYFWLTDNDGFTTALAVGDKVSFTVTKFKVFFGNPQIASIDPTSVTIAQPTMIESRDFFLATNSFNELDFDSVTSYPSGFYSGNFKIDSGPNFGDYVIHTANYTGTAFEFKPPSDLTVSVGQCYSVQYAALIYSFSAYTIMGTYDLPEFTEVTCADVGL